MVFVTVSHTDTTKGFFGIACRICSSWELFELLVAEEGMAALQTACRKLLGGFKWPKSCASWLQKSWNCLGSVGKLWRAVDDDDKYYYDADHTIMMCVVAICYCQLAFFWKSSGVPIWWWHLIWGDIRFKWSKPENCNIKDLLNLKPPDSNSTMPFSFFTSVTSLWLGAWLELPPLSASHHCSNHISRCCM